MAGRLNRRPVSRSYASTYARGSARPRRRAAAAAAAPECRSQPEAGEVSQSRTYCLSKRGCGRPGLPASAGQNRDESGVSTSSAEHQLAGRGSAAELELGVGQDDAALGGDLAAARA